MNRFITLLAILAAVSCVEIDNNQTDAGSILTDTESTPTENGTTSGSFEIHAEKESWMPAVKSSDDRAFAKDIPWQDGEKVMLIRTDSELIEELGLDSFKYMCTVSKAAGLKCTLEPEVPLVEGVYHAVYPVYDYLFYISGLYLHLSFLYELSLGLDYQHQDIVISEPVSYKEGHKLSFVMKHVCALVDIDIYPPKTGDFKLLKVVAANTVFAGKANYYINDEYDIDRIADVWFNFTTLRGRDNSMVEGELFQTSTGLLPVQYGGMPMNIYLVYEDGTYFLSETFEMSSLNFGEAAELVVDDFEEISVPVQGLAADRYMDSNPQPYDIIYWESNVYL